MAVVAMTPFPVLSGDDVLYGDVIDGTVDATLNITAAL